MFIFSSLLVTIHYTASKDLGGSSLGHPVRDRAIWHCRIDSVASIVVLRRGQRSGLDIQKG